MNQLVAKVKALVGQAFEVGVIDSEQKRDWALAFAEVLPAEIARDLGTMARSSGNHEVASAAEALTGAGRYQ